MIWLVLAIGFDDGKPTKAAAEKIVRVRTATGNMSVELPANARRHLKGQFLCVRLPEFGKEYAHLKIHGVPESEQAPADFGKTMLHNIAKKKGLDLKKDGDFEYFYEDTKTKSETGGVMHAWVSADGTETCVLTLVIEEATTPAVKRKIVDEIAPAMLKSLRREKDLAKEGKNVKVAGQREDIAVVDEKDPGMAAAVAEALATLPEFDDALKKPDGRSAFAVKRKFVEGENVEWMWVNKPKATRDGFEGVLNSEPEFLKNVKMGDAIKVKRSEVADWMYLDSEGAMVGGYSVRLLIERMPPAKRKETQENLGIDK